MWRKACPILMAALGVGLALSWRRLKRFEADEFERARADARAAGTRDSEPAFDEVRVSAGQVQAVDGAMAAAASGAGPDISSEWEQAVPPMDS